jgi:hypothetical protein
MKENLLVFRWDDFFKQNVAAHAEGCPCSQRKMFDKWMYDISAFATNRRNMDDQIMNIGNIGLFGEWCGQQTDSCAPLTDVYSLKEHIVRHFDKFNHVTHVLSLMVSKEITDPSAHATIVAVDRNLQVSEYDSIAGYYGPSRYCKQLAFLLNNKFTAIGHHIEIGLDEKEGNEDCCLLYAMQFMERTVLMQSIPIKLFRTSYKWQRPVELRNGRTVHFAKNFVSKVNKISI